MPMRSMTSALSSRNPAVSVNSKATPSTATGTSIISRVVPAISETMAASRPTNAFNKVDLPLLGGPAKTMRNPSFNFSAGGLASNCTIFCRNSAQTSVITILFCDSTSPSSEKSSSASVSADNLSTSCRYASMAALKAPPNILVAARRCHSVSADNRSAKPSASFKSMRPLVKARRVNSPASARLAPEKLAIACSRARTTARPPCRWSSTRSSPVAVSGPGKTSTSA